jgi:CrcB protein
VAGETWGEENSVSYLWVAIGGAVGAAARYGAVQWVGQRLGWTFPWGTLAVNGTGSLAIGLLLTVLLARDADPALRLLVITGFLGGYTTFSAFSLETLALLQERRWDAAALYVVGSVSLGLLACGAGIVVGRLIIR